MVMAAMVIVIRSGGILSQPISPSTAKEVRTFGVMPRPFRSLRIASSSWARLRPSVVSFIRMLKRPRACSRTKNDPSSWSRGAPSMSQ